MMKSLASLLTRSKSVPVTDEQVRRHREQRRQLDEWRADVDRLRAITGRLRTEYAKHKGDFAVGRYEELKTMVKSAINDLDSTTKNNKDRRQTAPPGFAYASGSASGLRTRAESFAVTQERIRSDEKAYSEMTVAQLESDIERMKRQVVQLKQEFRQERERLERLAAAYQDSKKLNPAQRYAALKDMIKDATSVASSSSLPTTMTSETPQRTRAAPAQRVTAVSS